MSFLNPLYDAVAWVMAQIHAFLSLFLSPSGGVTWLLAIVLLVVVMRLILVPLFVKQMHSMRKMSALTPQLQELRKKYKGDKQTLNEETMRLYREAGVNPLGGCLPLLAQMPMFFALFNVLRGIAGWNPKLPLPYGLSETVVSSAQRANIFGAHISDKVLFTGTMHVPFHAKVVILAAVAISVTTTFLTVRQSTKRGMTPQMTPDNPMAASQKYMAYIVPFFALSGLYWAFGLVLYWVTTNLWTLGQQYVLFKRYPSITPATAGAGTGTAGGIKPTAATGLVASNKSGTRRPASDAVKRPAPAKPSAAKPGATRPGTAKPGTAKPVSAGGNAVTRPSANGKPASAAKPAAARPAASAKPSATKPAAAKGGTSSGQAPARKPSGTPAAGPNRAPRGKSGQAEPSNGSGSGSGLLRRFGRGRAEPDEQSAEAEVKLVRQQRVRQSRSKRSGKR